MDSSTSTSNQILLCSICLDDVNAYNESDIAHLCPDKTHSSCCKSCMISYIENAIESAYFGTCPLITCPNASHVSDRNHSQGSSSDNSIQIGNKKRKILIYEEWKNIISPEASNKYNQLANSLLAFLCGGCHSLKTLDVGYDYEASSKYLKDHIVAKVTTSEPVPESESSTQVNKDPYEEFIEKLNLFCEGSLPLDELYKKIISEYLKELGSIGDKEAWEIFINILKMISDPERRANLHLRYLRDRPRIKTACCSREHCFKCRIKDFHDGKTCLESTETLDHSVVACPSCGISLTKGDGCNTITCVCGKQFSWTAEKENTEKCLQFLESFPTDTTLICSLALCSNMITEVDTMGFGNGFVGDKRPRVISMIKASHKLVCNQTISRAKAWQIRHRVAVNREMRNWFKKKFWPCPSQCCAILPNLLQQHLSNVSYGFIEGVGGIREEGVREAAEIWRAEHMNEVENFVTQNRIAISSLFNTFYPNPADKPAAAFRLITKKIPKKLLSTSEANLVESAKIWAEQNRELYSKEAEKFEVRSAEQFLYLYGKVHPSKTKPAYIFSPCATEWCRKTSNTDLTYTNSDTTVERVGSISCYPAAFANLVSDHCMFKIVLEAAPKTSNWITFGISKKGMVPSSSDGVGRTSNSWGISDDRSSSSSQSILASSGNEVSHFRKLKAGDVLVALVDTTEGWCDISVNEHELIQRFEIPPGSAADYCFAMTFANDHKVTILYDNADEKVNIPSAEKQGLLLNMEHTKMYNSLKKHIKTIVLSAENMEGIQLFNDEQSYEMCSPLLRDESRWLSLFNGSNDEALKAYELLKNTLYPILNTKPKASELASSDSISSLSWLTWDMLLDGISWYKENKRKIQIDISTDLANCFYSQHIDDATFIAAFNLIDYYNSKADTEDKRSALAFMQIYEFEMQSWYDYNANLRDPLIDNIDKNCRCLPRHTKNCPKHSK